jgi:hypothetical protein
MIQPDKVVYCVDGTNKKKKKREKDPAARDRPTANEEKHTIQRGAERSNKTGGIEALLLFT